MRRILAHIFVVFIVEVSIYHADISSLAKAEFENVLLQDLIKKGAGEPDNPALLIALKKRLPSVIHPYHKDRKYFLLEGDIKIPENKLPSYLKKLKTEWKATKNFLESRSTGSYHLEFLVRKLGPNGRLDIWPLEHRNLKYAVVKKTFRQQEKYALVVEAFKQASHEWSDLCSPREIKFQHMTNFDHSSFADLEAEIRQGRLDFYISEDSEIISGDGTQAFATAFFPSDTFDNKFININRSLFYKPDNKAGPVGFFRHEIGHVLGLRHEHNAANIPGCLKENGYWAQYGNYDPRSVMAYLCNNGKNPKLAFSKNDRAQFCQVYGQ